MNTVLVVNPGRRSKKYALYEAGSQVLTVFFEESNAGYEMCIQHHGEAVRCESLDDQSFAASFTRVAHVVNNYLDGKKIPHLSAIVVKVVAPGTVMQKHTLIDEGFLQALQARESAAPLHVPAVVRAIKNIRHHFPTVPAIAASDSAFHATMPPHTRNFSVAPQLAEELDIYRFGFHGLSVASVVRRMHAVTGHDPHRLVVCHVGDGASVTAVLDGKSVDTTMGFSPSTGLAMGSRGGDIDTAALIELIRLKHFTPTDAEMFLHTATGFQGMAGDDDLRRVLDRHANDDHVATNAVDIFVTLLQKQIAAMTAVLGGVDTIAFTATAGVRSSELRSLILNRLEHLGIKLNDERNAVTISKDGVISERNSAVKVVVIRTDEMGEMNAIADIIKRQTATSI